MNHHPEWEGILRAILEEPADDGLRLIAADWLEDNGQVEQAEWIRQQFWSLQNAPNWAMGNKELDILSRMPSCLDLPEARVDNYGWNGSGTTEVKYASGPSAWWRRGFAFSICCTLHYWLEQGASICSRHPIEQVDIIDKHALEYLIRDHGTGFYATLPAALEWQHENAASLLPSIVWQGVKEIFDARRGWQWTAGLARKALNHTCLNIARQGAGLPAIPWSEP